MKGKSTRTVSFYFMISLFRSRRYAQKYLRKHLSHVPPGNEIILDLLHKYKCSELWNRLSADTIQAIEAWLQVRTQSSNVLSFY